MRARLPLGWQMFLLATGNLVLLTALFVVFVKIEFRGDLESFLLTPSRDRLIAIGRQIALELEETEPDSRNTLLARYTRTYGVDFYLFDNEENRLAGSDHAVPAEVLHRMTRRPPPPPLSADQPPLDIGNSGEKKGPGFKKGGKKGMPPPGNPVFLVSTSNPTQYWVTVKIPIRSPYADPIPGNVLLRSSNLIGNPLFFDFKPWLLVGLGVLLLSLICWLPFVSALTRSISQMTRATGQIAEGHFEIQLPQSRPDELGQLSTAINRMSSRLSGFVNGQRRFLGDIAHELSSPIARMQFALGILDQRADPSLRPYLTDLQEEVQHMSNLVSELLSFTKAGMKLNPPDLTPVNVAETVGRVLAREVPTGANLQTLVDAGLSVKADPEYLFRAIANVVRNALRYAGEAGPIRISASAEGTDAVIRVADSGPGLPEDALEDVFKPFYRPETARVRTTGGVGLGLAIVKTCIEACAGTVRCRNLRPNGLEVEIRLPAGSAKPEGS